MKLLDAVLAQPVATSGRLVETLLEPPLPKPFLDREANESCVLFSIPTTALNLLEDNPTVGVAFARFVDAGHLAEARRLLAYSMDRRDSIWWAYLCAMEAARHKEITPDQKKGLDLVLAWLLDPNDIRRKQCKEAIRSCKSTSFAGILCFAVWLSGGSISPYAPRPIEPKPHVCGKLCGVVVYLASVYFDAGRWKTYLRHFLETGMLVAQGQCPIPIPSEAGQA
jgi:hypothetical protein